LKSLTFHAFTIPLRDRPRAAIAQLHKRVCANRVTRFAALLVLLLSAAPAHAEGAAQVSEPSQLALVALGVLGVIVGRNAAKRRKNDDD
jgi:hypothetical protein